MLLYRLGGQVMCCVKFIYLGVVEYVGLDLVPKLDNHLCMINIFNIIKP